MAQSIARQQHVSERIISRDVQFTRAIDPIADNAREAAKKMILVRDVKLTRQGEATVTIAEKGLWVYPSSQT